MAGGAEEEGLSGPGLASRVGLPIVTKFTDQGLLAMCGIVGYVGTRDAVPVILEGLRRLEYRGYDSAGVAVVEGGRLERRRAAREAKMIREYYEETVLKKQRTTNTVTFKTSGGNGGNGHGNGQGPEPSNGSGAGHSSATDAHSAH